MHAAVQIADRAHTRAACNPSMTIAAVAERALDNIVARDIGTLI